jgi:hypothetical protein
LVLFGELDSTLVTTVLFKIPYQKSIATNLPTDTIDIF